MAIKADRTYAGKVASGSCLIESNTKGTLGYQIQLECEDGETSHIIWLTPATIEKAKETFVMLGIKLADLEKPNYIDMQLAIDIAGRDVSMVTRDEGKYGVKVAFLNAPRKTGSASPAKQAAALFSGKPIPTGTPGREAGTKFDDEVPF